MSKWWDSKRLLVLLVGLVGTSVFAGWQVEPQPQWVAYLCMTYIAGQSVIDFAKAWRAPQ